MAHLVAGLDGTELDGVAVPVQVEDGHTDEASQVQDQTQTREVNPHGAVKH